MKDYFKAYLELLELGYAMYWDAMEEAWEKLEDMLFRQTN